MNTYLYKILIYKTENEELKEPYFNFQSVKAEDEDSARTKLIDYYDSLGDDNTSYEIDIQTHTKEII